MRALHDLVQSGKVRYIGASSMWAYEFATYQFGEWRPPFERGRPNVVQLPREMAGPSL